MKGNFRKQDGTASVSNESGPIPGNTGTLNGSGNYLSPFLDELHAKSFSTNLSRDDLKTLRSRSFVLAARVAQSFGIAELIRPTSIGFGFLIEMPGTPIRDESSQWGWWMLASLSDREMKLPDGAMPDLTIFCHRSLLSPRMLSNRAFKDLVHLIDCCRFIHKHFPETILWDRPTVDQTRQSAVFVGPASDGGWQR